jgi:5-methylthioribose kinase
MNLVLRVATSERSLIVKRARPWVERFPSIAAPVERADSEAAFYRLVADQPAIAARMPRLIDFDPTQHALVLEDLGVAADYTDLYRGATLPAGDAATLGHWLARLHTARGGRGKGRELSNLPLRRLNHAHVFRVPLSADIGIDLEAVTPGLQCVATTLASDSALFDAASRLGALYLADPGPESVLLHGDFFPGSWLRTESGPAVIDPEFAFFGPAEWDVGVLWGHLLLSGQPNETRVAVRQAYEGPAGFDWPLAERFAAVEVIRRLIGVAQLPLTIGLEAKRSLLAAAHATLATDAYGMEIRG